jgi:DNA-binding MurR/RpiR family transcriptional regulator
VAVAQVTDQGAELVELLAKAQRVWVVGEAYGACLAGLFAHYLRVAGLKATAVDADPVEAARALWDISAKDVVLGLGVPGTGIDTAALLSFAAEKGAATAAVSVSSVSPPAKVAEHVLVCPANTPVGLASPASLVTMLMALWQALLARDGKRMEEQVTTLQDTYASLLAARGEQGSRVDVRKIWQEF